VTHNPGRVRPGRAVAAICVLLSCECAVADPWLQAGDAAARHDVQVLADAGVLRTFASTWPLSWGDVADGLSRADVRGLDAEARAAFMRLSRRVEDVRRATGHEPHLRVALGEHPRRLRSFESSPREGEELESGASWTGLRLSYRLQATIVNDPADDEEFRLDGSYFGGAVGNWMISAGFMERWWGPGWDGSLILSTNARPIPSVALNRNLSERFKPAWLQWVGEWTTTILFGQLEDDRDVPNALFFGARFAFRPVPSLEIALSRTAQWCGDGRPCDLDTFFDLLVGNDNRGVQVTPEEEPGNQLAGADIRWTGGPHGRPYAIYGQMIGEDFAGDAPSKYIGLYGVESWGRIEALDSSWRVHVEYADTTTDFLGDDQFNTAYEHAIYTDGYRYRGRAIGHTLDNDSRLLTLGGTLLTAEERRWSVLLQSGEINRDDREAAPHTVSSNAADIWNMEVGHVRALGPGNLTVTLGFERFDDLHDSVVDDSVSFFMQWQTSAAP
jgi:hypothetical protein